MDIKETRIKISDVYSGYINDDEEGVTALNDRLDIRPKYQREFVYSTEKQREVIRSIMKGLPLNVMYWVKTGVDEDGEDTYEVLDGQQRTLSIMEFLEGNFSVDDMLFDNLPKDKQEQILNYELFVYVCDGTESEKLEWFKIINVAGEKLTDQELRNAVYAGSWTTSAKKYFSKTGGPASQTGADYLKGYPIRQDYLETALKWIADKENKTIEQYMSEHQHDSNAVKLWNYFNDVIEWVKATFPKKRKEMHSVPWGILYNKYGDNVYDANELEKKVSALMADEDVTHKAGVYAYVLDGDEKNLSIRAFSDRDKRTAYEKQNGICPMCGRRFEYSEMDGDHKKAWSDGGHTVPENCQMLCHECNLKKSAKSADFSK